MARRALLSLSCIAWVLPACAALPSLEGGTSWRRWSHRHGGILEEPALQRRADAALSKLRTSTLRASLRVHVLGDDDAAAHAWHPGDLFVTRGLVEALDPTALAAALAHEIGHLLARRRDDLDPRDERVADRLGQEILAQSGLPSDAMPRMLRTLGARSGAHAAPALRRRARLLEQQTAIARTRLASAQTALNPAPLDTAWATAPDAALHPPPHHGTGVESPGPHR